MQKISHTISHIQKKIGYENFHNPLISLVGREGIEPSTY